MTVFVHVGLPKTGTTTIQRNLFANAALLSDKYSVNYPDFRSNHWPMALPFYVNQKPVSLHKNAIAAGKGTERSFQRDAKRFWREFERSHSRFEHHIFSSEGFCALNVETAGGMRRHIEGLGETVKAVVYVRHPAEHFSSRLAQNVKSGYRVLDRIKADSDVFEKQIARLVDVYGKESLIVRRFGRSYFENGDLMDDMLFCTIGRTIADLPRKTHNEGLSLPAVLILDRLNGIAPRFTRKRAPFHYFKNIKGPKFLAPRSVVEEYVERSRGYIEYLEREFGLVFDEVDMSQFPEEIAHHFGEETLESLAEVLNRLSKKRKRAPLRESVIDFMAKLRPGKSDS